MGLNKRHDVSPDYAGKAERGGASIQDFRIKAPNLVARGDSSTRHPGNAGLN